MNSTLLEDVLCALVFLLFSIALVAHARRNMFDAPKYKAFYLTNAAGLVLRDRSGEMILRACPLCPTRSCDCPHEMSLALKTMPGGTRMVGLTLDHEKVLLQWSIATADLRDDEEPRPMVCDVREVA